jgi:aspartate kinase
MPQVIITENQSAVTFNNVPASYENSFICRILEQAAKDGISIDMIAQSPATSDKISFGFTIDDNDMPKLLAITKNLELIPLTKAKQDSISPLINCGNVKVTVKSGKMVNNTGFAAKVFSALAKLNCCPLLITTGIDEISLLVGKSDKTDLERELELAFK